MRPPNLCAHCKHFQKGFTCTAFPSGIPKSIVKAKVYHISPYRGDQGVRFEARDNAPQWVLQKLADENLFEQSVQNYMVGNMLSREDAEREAGKVHNHGKKIVINGIEYEMH
jgi:hypothetical protein